MRGFEKVYLQEGEERTVLFKVDVNELAYYEPATNSWKIEKMQYEVFVGNSSRDKNMLTDKFELK